MNRCIVSSNSSASWASKSEACTLCFPSICLLDNLPQISERICCISEWGDGEKRGNVVFIFCLLFSIIVSSWWNGRVKKKERKKKNKFLDFGFLFHSWKKFLSFLCFFPLPPSLPCTSSFFFPCLLWLLLVSNLFFVFPLRGIWILKEGKKKKILFIWFDLYFLPFFSTTNRLCQHLHHLPFRPIISASQNFQL